MRIYLCRTWARSLPTIVVVVFAACVACGRKDADPTASSSTASSAAAPAAVPQPLQPGISQTLTRSKGAPFYNFDSLGPIQYPAVQKSNQISSDADNMVSGWALDQSKKGPAGAVDVVIDQVPYSARYGADRSDVAAHFNRPDYANSGFQLTLARGQLSKGPHAMSIRVISSDKKSYTEGPVVQFVVN